MPVSLSVTPKPRLSYESVKIAEEILPKLGNAKQVLGADTFARLDASRDGRLSTEELAHGLEPLSSEERMALRQTATQIRTKAIDAVIAPSIVGGVTTFMSIAWRSATLGLATALVGVPALLGGFWLMRREREANAPLFDAIRQALTKS